MLLIVIQTTQHKSLFLIWWWLCVFMNCFISLLMRCFSMQRKEQRSVVKNGWFMQHTVWCSTQHTVWCTAALSLLLTKRTQWFSAVKLSLVGLTTALVQCSKEKNSNVWPLSVWNTLFLGRQILRSENKFMCFDSLPLILLFNEVLLAHHWMRIYDKLLSWTIGR